MRTEHTPTAQGELKVKSTLKLREGNEINQELNKSKLAVISQNLEKLYLIGTITQDENARPVICNELFPITVSFAFVIKF